MKLQRIEIRASRRYEVLIGTPLLPRAGELAAPLIEGRKALIAAGERVWTLYGGTLRSSLEAAGFAVTPCVYPSGEEAKTPETLMTILRALGDGGFSRADAVFALGGGVTGDMAGLAAALYQRGLACVLLPTTLLAAADASVGGKTAVNLPGGKNQMGVFAQPRLVLCDTDCFATLEKERLAEGWAEIVKCAFLCEEPWRELLFAPEPAAHLPELVAACVSLKARLVEADEFDRGERQLLNFGHTLGHAIENCSGFTVPHGMAVAAGMAIVTRAAQKRGLCDRAAVEALETLLDRFGLPKRCEYPAEALLRAAAADKKRRGERFTLVLPRGFGRCERIETDEEGLAELIGLGL